MDTSTAIREVDHLTERLRQSKRATAVNVWLLSTFDADGKPHGLAVTNTSALADNPPSMLVSVSRQASSHPILISTGTFCLNMIHRGQFEVLEHFSHSDKRSQRFSSGPWKSGPLGLPYLETALANLFCRIDEAHDYGNHTVLFGRVIDVYTTDHLKSADPLIWINGRPAQFNNCESGHARTG